jgi:excisionase family DNA binding protein
VINLPKAFGGDLNRSELPQRLPQSAPGAPQEKEDGPKLGSFWPSWVAGCTGLEPLGSGVTVDARWIVGARSDSQDAVTTGNTLERSSPFSQPFAAVSRPLGTSLVQSGAIDAGSVRWVSVRELAAMLRVSTSTVYQAAAAGEIPHLRVSNAIRIALRSGAAR